MTTPPTVVIAMSGGVDSSVAAALLLEKGYRVIGMMLRLWSEPGTEEANRCCTPDAMAQARRVAAQLGFPFYAIDAQQPFYENVVQYFLQSYADGRTSNPCMICNRTIRWGLSYDQARLVGADYLATGHYARIRRQPDGDYQLLCGLDPRKDQSYVLSSLNQEQLAHTLFPLGELNKTKVREYAHQLNLAVAERPDSQDLCFLGDTDYHQFLRRHQPSSLLPGPIINRQGDHLGQHDGLPLYTIGQRKGLRIAANQPLYVLDKDFSCNALIVGFEEELLQSTCYAGDLHWIAGASASLQQQVQVKIRYKAEPVPATIDHIDQKTAKITFQQPLLGLTPGQFAVFYDGEIVLGNGMIQLSISGGQA